MTERRTVSKGRTEGGTRKKAPSRPPTILLVDDHPIWRDSLKRLLERKRAGEIVGEASDGDDALSLATSMHPDIVIMDVDLPTLDGIEATRRIHSKAPGTKVLFLSATEARSDVTAAIRSGASAYLLKTAAPDEVIDAVRRVYAGEMVFPPALTAFVREQLQKRGMAGTANPGEVARPRPRPRSEASNVFVKEGEFWTLRFDGTTVRMKDSKGMRYIAELLRAPGRGIHSIDLVIGERGIDPDSVSRGSGAKALDLGYDSGVDVVALDTEAKKAYRQRLTELEPEIEEARSWGDLERLAKASEEAEFIVAELSKSVGLGGRDRKAFSVSERARLNVSRAISAAVKRIMAAHPTLGHHLDSSLKTGTFCTYAPLSDLRWTL